MSCVSRQVQRDGAHQPGDLTAHSRVTTFRRHLSTMRIRGPFITLFLIGLLVGTPGTLGPSLVDPASDSGNERSDERSDERNSDGDDSDDIEVTGAGVVGLLAHRSSTAPRVARRAFIRTQRVSPRASTPPPSTPLLPRPPLIRLQR